MASYLDYYKARVSLGTTNRKDKLIKQAERTFERQLLESPSAKTLRATVPGQINVLETTNRIECIVLDISDNDIKAFDQKYLLVRKDENFDIGCYVEFDGAYWLAAFKEHRTLDTHKKFTLYKCNNIWNYKKDGRVYHFPIYVQNLSLYSDGLADNKYSSQEDGKLSVYYGENPITKQIKINTRIAIGNRLVFRMTNINDYEFRSSHNGECAIKAMLLQTTILDNDDLFNNIAWNEESDLKQIDTSNPTIVGDKKVMLGSKKTYTCSKDVEYKHWEIECGEELRRALAFSTPGGGDKHCEIKFPANIRFVGEVVKLKLFASNELKDTLEITLRSI